MSKAELSKDQEFIVKKQVSDWAKSIKLKKFDENFEIIECEPLDLYKIKVKERLCNRFFSNEVKPYENEIIKPGPLKDIWKYQTEGKNSQNNDLPAASISEDFFNNLKKNPKLLKKNNLNNIIDHLEDYECYKNDLIESIKSSYQIDTSYDLAVCPDCVGKGTTICYNCNGSGKKACSRCDGTKWITHYNAPRERCSSCNGTGYKICSTCDGAKKNICDTCEGKGKAIRYISLNEFFTTSEIEYNYNQIIPDGLKNRIAEESKFNTLEEIMLSPNNKNSIMKGNQLLNDIPNLKEIFNWKWNESEKNLTENQRIDNLNFSLSKINVIYLKYKYMNKEYDLALCGDDYQVIYEDSPVGKHKNSENNDFSDKSRTSTLVLCLFLGFLGVHRFYAKRYVSAIFELLSSIIFIGFIWAFVDFIIILCGGFKDGDKKLIKNW